ncbi:MAG: Fic family protein [Candidatus Daviesbacteria bacterium]|nr:Fic family protein [Candidatus Daviesbacteria bacterium]
MSINIPPVYQITPEMVDLISKINANLIYLSAIDLPEELSDKLQRNSILKSSLFSARIEGNTLTLEAVNNQNEETDEKKEVFNLLKAIQFIQQSINFSSSITTKTILDIHQLVMTNLYSENGFREASSAIFNQAGVAVYITPAPAKVPELIKLLLKYSNSDNEKFPIINAFISHLIFEKIHPFLDGNGRVGRLLIFTILKSKQNNNHFFIPFEEYLDTHRQDYYYHLDQGLKYTNDYLLFMLNAFYQQTENTKRLIEEELRKDQPLLTPRQEEILNIIQDQRIVSFVQIKRRFMSIPARTLSYDLKKLMNMKLVAKIGKTKGSYYQKI